jgi:hypothetical protein
MGTMSGSNLTPPDGWDKVPDNDGRIYWDTPGMEVTGLLISVEDVTGINNKPSKEGTISAADGKKRFYMTTDLQQKMASIPLGTEIKIQYICDIRTKRGMTVKKFAVFTRKPEVIENLF